MKINFQNAFVGALSATAALSGQANPTTGRKLLDHTPDVPTIPPPQPGAGLNATHFPNGVFSTRPTNVARNEGSSITVGRQPDRGNQTSVYAIQCTNRYDSNSEDHVHCFAVPLDLSEADVVTPSLAVAIGINNSTDKNNEPANDVLYDFARILRNYNAADCSLALLARNLRASFGHDDVDKMLRNNKRLIDHKAVNNFHKQFHNDNNDIDIGCNSSAPAWPPTPLD